MISQFLQELLPPVRCVGPFCFIQNILNGASGLNTGTWRQWTGYTRTAGLVSVLRTWRCTSDVFKQVSTITHSLRLMSLLQRSYVSVTLRHVRACADCCRCVFALMCVCCCCRCRGDVDDTCVCCLLCCC